MWIKGRANLLQRQTGQSGSPRVGKRIPDANLIPLFAEKIN
jgi:hypothetical protein